MPPGSAGPSLTSHEATLQPSCAKRRAVALPMPAAAPVTMTTLSCSPVSIMIFHHRKVGGQTPWSAADAPVGLSAPYGMPIRCSGSGTGASRADQGVCPTSLEAGFQCKLNDSRPGGRGIDNAQRRGYQHVVVWVGEVHAVEGVEKLRTEFQFALLRDGERFDNRDVEVPLIGSAQNVAPRSAEWRDVGAGGGKRGVVEVLVQAALYLTAARRVGAQKIRAV